MKDKAHPTPQVRISNSSATHPGQVANVIRISPFGLVLEVRGELVKFVPANHVQAVSK